MFDIYDVLELNMKVFDEDITSDDTIGSASIDLEGILEKCKVNEWVSFKNNNLVSNILQRKVSRKDQY